MADNPEAIVLTVGQKRALELHERLWTNTRRFKAELKRLGFDTGVSETPITPVMTGDSALAGKFSDRLFQEGIFAQPIVFPTVALDKARIRTIVTAAHTDAHLDLALGRVPVANAASTDIASAHRIHVFDAACLDVDVFGFSVGRRCLLAYCVGSALTV